MEHRKIIELIPDFHDRELSESEAASVRLHLSACDDCRRELRSLERIKTFLPRPAVTASSAFTARVMANLPKPSDAVRWRWLVPSLGAAFASLALIFLSPAPDSVSESESFLLEETEFADEPIWLTADRPSRDSDVIKMTLEGV